MPDEELERILKSVPPLSDTTELPGWEDILSEYHKNPDTPPDPPVESSKQEKPVKPEKPKKTPKSAALPGEDDDDTLEFEDLEKRSKSMKEFAQKAETLRANPGEPKAEPVLSEFTLSPEFGEHFSPSDAFLMPEDSGQLFEEPKKPGLLQFLARLKQAPEAPALTLPQAYAAAQRYAVNLRMRAVLALVLLLPLIVVSCCQTWGFLPGFLTYSAEGKPYLTLFFMVLLQFAVMLCGIDILGKGLADLIRLRPGGETLVALSCFASLLQVASIVLRTSSEGIFYNTAGFLPYCAVSAASVFFALWGVSHRQTALARTYKIAVSTEDKCDCVVSEERLWGGLPGFARHSAKPEGFVAQTETPDVALRVTRFLTPLLIVAFFVLGLLSASGHSSVATGSGGVQKQQYFFFTFAALCCAGVPMTTFGAFSYVFSRLAARLSHMGGAVTGWAGSVEMSRGSHIVIGDSDLFPPGTLALNGLKILGDHSFESIISLSASLLYASGSGLYGALNSIIKGQDGYLRPVSSLEAFEGGMSGIVGGERVMVGTLNFMHSMGIQVPSELSSKSAVFTSVNHDLAGVLAVSYTPATQVKGALLLLEQQKMTGILAVRDVNITPTLLRDKFGVNPDLPEFPVVEERLALSDPERPFHGKISAVLARDGLCPYAETVIGGQRLHKFTLINLCVHLISLVLGVFLVFYFASQTQPSAAGAISPANLLIYMLIWWVVQWLVSSFSHRY
ncbi:MAG: hypothetical protein LBR72_08100 [Oscillospiraceae bacterium]|jgi:hypothetical protein|nr:hypothetical protein [Oscillospiraceae bacterium]